MEAAASGWEARLTDPIRLRIEVNAAPVTELGFAAGFTNAEIDAYRYSLVRQALQSDATSDNDRVAIRHLPSGPRLTLRTHTSDGEPILTAGDDPIHQYVIVTHANAKALGIPVSDPSRIDAEIKWNEFFLDNVFDFDRSDGIDGTDFRSSAEHEMGHALGFFSGADDVDYFSRPEGPGAPLELNNFAVLNVPDLFRFTDNSLPHPDIAPGGSPFFSIDGGVTREALFATGAFNGDGDQASHWKDGTGLMDAVLDDAEIIVPSAADLLMFDVIGWDLAIVPEPSAATITVLAMLLLPFACRSFVKNGHCRRSVRVGISLD